MEITQPALCNTGESRCLPNGVPLGIQRVSECKALPWLPSFLLPAFCPSIPLRTPGGRPPQMDCSTWTHCRLASLGLAKVDAGRRSKGGRREFGVPPSSPAAPPGPGVSSSLWGWSQLLQQCVWVASTTPHFHNCPFLKRTPVTPWDRPALSWDPRGIPQIAAGDLAPSKVKSTSMD